MSQPTPYSRQFDFTGWSATRPSDQQPGTSLDAEMNAVKVTLDAVLANLVQIQRDDGALKNSTVTLDTLATDVLNTLGSGQGWIPRGAWVTATAYEAGDVVAEDGSTYVATVAHTSGTFSTDEAADKWVPIFGAVASGSISDGAVTGPKIADGAVSAAKLGFTSLDLTGTLRGQGGIAGGTAIAGVYPVAGKLDSGDAFSSVARDTKAQGRVGFRADGGTGGIVWELSQPTNSDIYALSYATGGVTTDVIHISKDSAFAIGSSLSAWSSTLKVVQVGATGAVASDTGGLFYCMNAYYDGTNWRYKASGVASRYYTSLGEHKFDHAVSGTAGNIITWVQIFKSDTSGNLQLGNPSSPAGRLAVRAATGGKAFYFQNSVGQDLFYSGSDPTLSAGENAAGSAAYLTKSASTSRSLNAAGTINASGADYAEYMRKTSGCGTIAPGDICGVNADGELTDTFADAHSFVIKSTRPAYVGGDDWGAGISDPVELEAIRVEYDRIAFAGQVPVNVLSAVPGDWIDAIEGPGGSIIGAPVDEPSMATVGKAWKILPDGRAWVAVKVA